MEISRQDPTAGMPTSLPRMSKILVVIVVFFAILSLLKIALDRDDPNLAYPNWQPGIRRLSYEEIVQLYKAEAAKDPALIDVGIDNWARAAQANYGNLYDFSALFAPRVEASSGNGSTEPAGSQK